MTDAPFTPADDDDALAAELSLRVLSGAEEAGARARADADAAFARRVEAWDERFGVLAEEIAPVTPGAHLWPRVETVAGAANDDEPRVRFWRRWAVGASALAAASFAVAVFLALQPPAIAPAPAAGPVTRVATLTLEDGAVAMTVVYDPATGELYLAPTDKMQGDVRVPHLWLLMPEGGVRLVGAIDGSATSRHTLSGAIHDLAGEAAQVAVSMEQPGHTPAATAPDGPVVASGSLQQL
ncbi:MAG: anti-sigma factor [Alphaproteobacteria bacterium]|nr:anti-sigma factor [Alphaproteobacteria bacterium]MBU1526156.1 anti-sigma factor [Alphaproteobacteria bacterium]MBU2117425.1 anti-sigma factor [Alphaproteobacteria bacterium]MBU2350508.1 anti-sigma factor [Alphaproteobacteria bacterium]MBU2380973.1 anti-sigma factor [Alphaproteobacteria bacterium]